MRRLVVLLVCLLAAGTALAGFSFAGLPSSKNAGITNVTVHMGDYFFQLSARSVPAGTVVFTLINDGMTDHDFSIAGKTSPTVSPKSTLRMTAVITRAGEYSSACTLPGHAAAGMEGTLTVRGATTSSKPTATLKVIEDEWKIVLKTSAGKTVRSVKHGRIRFKVTNIGDVSHDFVIAKHRTVRLAPGKSATLTVSLKQGRYKYLCSVAGHAPSGMKGTLLVR
jgi:uncharacterized cupredoxin-like copper-binding protein